MSATVIIAAVEHELGPLVRRWKAVSFTHEGRRFRAHEKGDLVAIAGGIGCRAARIAAGVAINRYAPGMLISAGLAGALLNGLRVGSVIIPNVIIDAETGAEYRCDSGDGVLVTAGRIINSEAKPELAERFHASFVDMEASAVAEVAEMEKIGFRCVKAISDEPDFVMPPLDRFVDANGDFHTGRFVGWAVLRPRHWRQTMAMARDSSLAAHALCDWLGKNVSNNLPPSAVVRIERAEMSKAKR